MPKAISVEGLTIDEFEGVEWIKSSESTPGTLDDCVVVGALPDDKGFAIGDTKTLEGLSFTTSEFSKFIRSARAGEFDHLIKG